MFTVRGNGLSTRVCQPASVNNYDFDSNKEQLITNRIRPLSHGVLLPQIPWQHSFHRNTLPVPPSSKSRNNSAVLLSSSRDSVTDAKPSSFPNFRTLEKVESDNNRLEDKVDKKQPMDSYTSSLDYTDLLKFDNKTVDFKTPSDCTADVSNKHAFNDINLPPGSQKKKKHNFHKYSGRKSRCKTKKEHKKRKLRKQFDNDQQNAIHSISSSIHPALQVQPVTKQKSSKVGPENSGTISLTNSVSSTKSLRQSSSHTSLCSEVFQRASTIYSNLRKSCQEKEREKIKRVYLSDKQSGVIKDCGVTLPCAPPCSPTIEQLAKVEYVLSMNDIRSQRAVKERLSQIDNKSKKRELARKEEAKRIEKQYIKDQELLKKQRQRLEIYALNKIMTELEEKQFQEFCKIMNSDSNKSSTNIKPDD